VRVIINKRDSLVQEGNFQENFSINIVFGFVGGNLVGPSGKNYLNFFDQQARWTSRKRPPGNKTYYKKKTNQECYLIFYFIKTFVLIVHKCILAVHSRFIGWLPLEKSIIN
jgi:hypothetical protein